MKNADRITDEMLVPDHPKRKRIGNYIAYFALAVAFIGVATFLRWSNASTDVLTIKNQPFPVRMTGEAIVMEVDYCKNIDIEGQLRMSFVSKTDEEFLPLAPENGPKQCTKAEFPILLPKDLAPDTYRVKFRVTYDINPLKKGVVNEFYSGEFEVK